MTCIFLCFIALHRWEFSFKSNKIAIEWHWFSWKCYLGWMVILGLKLGLMLKMWEKIEFEEDLAF